VQQSRQPGGVFAPLDPGRTGVRPGFSFSCYVLLGSASLSSLHNLGMLGLDVLTQLGGLLVGSGELRAGGTCAFRSFRQFFLLRVSLICRLSVTRG
jgi:hypothetical protein